MIRRIFLAVCFICLAAPVARATCALPFTFAPNTPARASEVMANFNALAACFNDVLTTSATNATLPAARTNLGASVTGGIWPGSLGGTGVDNGSRTITTGGSLTTTGSGPTVLAFPAGVETFTFPPTTSTLMSSTNDNATLPDALNNPGLGTANDVSFRSLILGGQATGIINLAGAYPTSQASTAWNISGNFSNGNFEANFWNIKEGAGGFDFRQKTGASASTQLAAMTTTAVIVPLATASTSTTTGALVVTGGVGVAGRLNVGGAINQFGDAAGTPAHLATGQLTAPALTSCGTGSLSIVGTDTAGTVTTGTDATGCVITFNVAYTGAPHCVVTWQSTPAASQSYIVSNTAITLTQTSASGRVVNYNCIAPSGG